LPSGAFLGKPITSLTQVGGLLHFTLFNKIDETGMFQMRIDYGVMTSCLVKPVLYILQKTSPRIKLSDQNCSKEDTDSNTGDYGQLGRI
jgi:hypothetical protein